MVFPKGNFLPEYSPPAELRWSILPLKEGARPHQAIGVDLFTTWEIGWGPGAERRLCLLIGFALIS